MRTLWYNLLWTCSQLTAVKTASRLVLTSTQWGEDPVWEYKFHSTATENAIPPFIVGFTMCFDAVVRKQIVTAHRGLQTERSNRFTATKRDVRGAPLTEKQIDKLSTGCQL